MASVHPSQSREDSSQKKGSRKRNEINIIYANPLPVSFSPIENRFAVTILGIFGVSPIRVLNPRCEGTFDPTTRSVWVTNRRDSMILWRRGFFGKGNLSRSEPSWLARQSNVRVGPGGRTHQLCLRVVIWTHGIFILDLTSEEVTAKRRVERKQFKQDRSRAMAAAAAEAEAAFAEGRIIPAEKSKASIPSAATWKPSNSTRNIVPPRSDHLQDAADLCAQSLEEDMEHLQLTLVEAFFLTWGLDCLTIYHSQTVRSRHMCVFIGSMFT